VLTVQVSDHYKVNIHSLNIQDIRTYTRTKS